MACLSTYVGLCIYSRDMSPEIIGRILELESTREFVRDPKHKYQPQRQHNFWSLSTKDLTESKSQDDHLREIFSRLEGKDEALARLRDAGCDMCLSVYWETDGQGGPSLSSGVIEKLALYGLEIWWDIYCSDSDEGDDT